MKYKDLNENDIRRAASPIFEKMEKVGLLTDEEKDRIFGFLPKCLFRDMGENLYRLPGGAITGQGGWNLFQEEFKKQALNNGFSTSSDR